jgi:chromate transport protein ChrA
MPAKKEKTMTLINLFLPFFYVGLFAIGGGLVAISIMYAPIVGAREMHNVA